MIENLNGSVSVKVMKLSTKEIHNWSNIKQSSLVMPKMSGKIATLAKQKEKNETDETMPKKVAS